MKRLSVSCVLFSYAIVALYSVSAAPAKFQGTWVLSRAKSEGLTGGLANAEIVLVVTQTEKQLTAEQKIRIRGREQPSQPLTYNLDGTESTAEVVRPLAGTMYLKAKLLEKGRALNLLSTISGDNQGKEVTIITREHWELDEGGKALKVLRIRETAGKTQQFKLYFERQP
jgi:hypothetical protein